MRNSATRIFSAAVLVAMPSLTAPLLAQDSRVRERPQVTVFGPGDLPLLWTRSADRAVLGVTLATGSSADTAGVRVESVDTDGPAAKAGIKAGDILTEINGTNLRVAAVDAEDLALAGLAQRRLQRTLAKAKPGDDVKLTVRSGSAARTVTVKTVSAAELDGTRVATTGRVRSAAPKESQGAIGLSIGGSSSVRDTLGLFVASVVSGGPAEKAGIIEGERIAAVNGIDVRVARDDVEDASVASARIDRFVREVQKTAPGGTVNLRVYGNGRYRDVAVGAVKMSEVGGGSVIINGSVNGQPLRLDSRNIEETVERFRQRMEDMGKTFRYEIHQFPRGGTEGGVRVISAPRRTLTRM